LNNYALRYNTKSTHNHFIYISRPLEHISNMHKLVTYITNSSNLNESVKRHLQVDHLN